MNIRGMTLRLELFVTDLRASVDFYTHILGFEIAREADDYVAVHNGHVLLGLGPVAGLSTGHYFRPEVTQARKGVGVEIVLEVDNVQAALQRVIDHGARLHTPLKQRPWGLTDFRIVDPDGYFLRITSRA